MEIKFYSRIYRGSKVYFIETCITAKFFGFVGFISEKYI